MDDKKPSVSQKLKGAVSSLLGFRSIKPDSAGVSFRTSREALGQIYDLMVELEQERKLRGEIEQLSNTLKQKEENRRNQEIIKALTGRKKPVQISKKVKETKKEIEKPPAPEKPPEVPPGAPPTKPVTPPAAPPTAAKPPAPPAPAPAPAPAPPVVKPPAPPPVTAKPPILPTVVAGVTAAATGLLPLLAKAESGDYNQLVYPKIKGSAPDKANLTDMTIKEVLNYQDEMAKSGKYPSNAVGKYQIIKSTLIDGIKYLNIDPNSKFDKTVQDRLYKEWLTGGKRKKLGDYLSGKVPDTAENLAEAQLDFAKEFASVGVPYRVWRERAVNKNGKEIWDGRWIEPGQSYYIGSGGNKASVSPEKSAQALKEERNLRLGSSGISPVAPSVGATIDTKSQEVSEMKKSLSEQPQNILQQNNITTQSSQPQQVTTDKKVNISPALVDKGRK